MVGLRKKIQTEGIASEQTSGMLIAVRVIFNTIVVSIAISGLMGLVIFSCVYWFSFS